VDTTPSVVYTPLDCPPVKPRPAESTQEYPRKYRLIIPTDGSPAHYDTPVYYDHNGSIYHVEPVDEKVYFETPKGFYMRGIYYRFPECPKCRGVMDAKWIKRNYGTNLYRPYEEEMCFSCYFDKIN